MIDHIPNRLLTPALVPASDAEHADVILPFGVTYHAYQVWGDFETVRQAAEATWRRLPRWRSPLVNAPYSRACPKEGTPEARATALAHDA
jgi:hypothetical protein